jgi:hypothetical protein
MRRECEWCGKPFDARSSLRRFCGSKCRYAAKDRRQHVQRGTRVEATCKRCGAEFVYQSSTKPRVYCFICRPVVETGARTLYPARAGKGRA